MAQEYSLKAFLKKAPNHLLKRYLTDDLDLKIPWHKLSEASADEINKVIQSATEETRQKIEQDFREIHDMADESGHRLFIEEGRNPHHNVELADVLDGMTGHLECAFYVFLEHPKVFYVASRFHEAEKLPRPRKRDRLPKAEPGTTQETSDRLGKAISEYYTHSEGRGYAYQIEHYARSDRLYWFAYASDYADSRLVFEGNEMESRTERPAFQIVFVYSAEERSLEISLKGNRQRLLDLQCIFGNVVLGVDLRYKDLSRLIYDLGCLKDRKFKLLLKPEDGVDSVTVRKLRLRIIGRDNDRITLEANTKQKPQAVYDLLDIIIASDELSLDLIQVISVRLALAFRAKDREAARTVVFDVSTPDSCSLKHDPRHYVARNLLKRWGIDVSASSENDAADARLPVQFTNRA